MGSLNRDQRRDDPLERLRRLRPSDIDEGALTELLHELQVHEEELTAQNRQLIETQHALEESRDRYVDLYDFAPIGFMTISESGVIREINLTGASLLHSERGKILGLPFKAFVRTMDKSRFAEHLRQCRDLDQTTATTELALNAGDHVTHVQLVTRRHGSEHEGETTRSFLTAIIDISQRKRLEEERRHAQDANEKLVRDREIARARADAKDHFLAILSHELRTPLTPIVATLSDDRLLSLAPEPLLYALQTVRRNLDLEVRLIDDLLDVTRISRDRLVVTREQVNIHDLLRDVTAMLDDESRQCGVRVACRLDAPHPRVIGDSRRLSQVFWNLLGNAIKFSNAGATVMIESSGKPGGFIEVSVTDTGAGMNEAVVRSINDPGEGAAEMPIQPASGLGLGLAICRGVMKAHGGTLRAVSQGRNHGSSFVVRIPVDMAPERTQRTPRSSEQPRKGPALTRRILLVEDHRDSADTLSQLLMFHDYHVRVARTMQEAIAAANQEVFDLLISDIRLPDGSGLDLIRRVQSQRPIRGIAISGFGTEQDQRRSREAGYETHLTKPLDFNQLLDAIERIVSSA
jgi:PAS domain S-box-containing protein